MDDSYEYLKNSSQNGSHYCNGVPIHIVLSVSYFFTFLLTLFPNLSLLYIIIHDKSLRTKSFSWFLINFSICDSPPLLLLSVRSVGYLISNGEFNDRPIVALYFMFLAVQSITYLFISVLRWRASRAKIMTYNRLKISVILIGFCWITGLIYFIMLLVVSANAVQTITNNLGIVSNGVEVYLLSVCFNIACYYKLRKTCQQEILQSSSTTAS